MNLRASGYYNSTLMRWEQDISMFDWFFTPNNTSSKVIAITIGTIKYCYNNSILLPQSNISANWRTIKKPKCDSKKGLKRFMHMKWN